MNTNVTVAVTLTELCEHKLLLILQFLCYLFLGPVFPSIFAALCSSQMKPLGSGHTPVVIEGHEYQETEIEDCLLGACQSHSLSRPVLLAT